jgi:hypothetical protein
VSAVRLIVATRNSGPPGSGKIIKEMPGSVASGTPCIFFILNLDLLQKQYKIHCILLIGLLNTEQIDC